MFFISVLFASRGTKPVPFRDELKLVQKMICRKSSTQNGPRSTIMLVALSGHSPDHARWDHGYVFFMWSIEGSGTKFEEQVGMPTQGDNRLVSPGYKRPSFIFFSGKLKESLRVNLTTLGWSINTKFFWLSFDPREGQMQDWFLSYGPSNMEKMAPGSDLTPTQFLPFYTRSPKLNLFQGKLIGSTEELEWNQNRTRVSVPPCSLYPTTEIYFSSNLPRVRNWLKSLTLNELPK